MAAKDETRYTFRFRKPSGQYAACNASPTMNGVSLMVADMLIRQAGVSPDEARTFAANARNRWSDNMYERIEHVSGYEFHLAPAYTGRRRW
jgi:hypothetical protein